MNADPGLFEAFYASPLQHPILLWLAAGLGLAAALSRPGLSPSMRRYCTALFALTCMDAWLTATPILGLGSLGGWLASAVPLFFVLAGDYRYLLLVMCATAEGEVKVTPRGALIAAGLTVIVPPLAQVLVGLLPEPLNSLRAMFLIYEVSFALLALTLLYRNVGAPWVRRVSRFVVVYYLLWATADAIILAMGWDLGYLLRVVPNMLYYGGLIGVMGHAAARQTSG